MCLQYTRSKLWAIGASLERKQQSLPLKTLHILRSENICATPKTKRGTVGGVNHFRVIPALYNNNRDLPTQTVTGANVSNLVQMNAPFGRDMPSGLKFVQWNARSVYPKLDELRFIMCDPLREADVLGITETWLNSSYAHSSTEIDGYNHERRDRRGGRGGGVAVYIRDEIPYSRRTDLQNEHLEDLWI